MRLVEYIIRFREQSKGIDNANQKVDELDNRVKRTNKTLSVGTVAAVAAASLAVVSFVGSSIKAFDQQEKAIAQVRTGIQTTGGVAGRTLQQLTDQASALQRDTLFGDEEILQGVTAQLLTFTNIAGKEFDRTQKAALDLATRLDADLSSTTIQLGKALNDPIANLSALSRSGIQFSEDQRAVIKSLVETNQLADAQSIILTELEKQYGGSAAAAAAAGTGGLKQLQNSLGDIKELIGGALLPIINFFAQAIRGITAIIQNNQATFSALVQGLGVLAAIIAVVVAAIKIWSAVQTVINILLIANPIGIVVVAIAALVVGIIALVKRSETARGIFQGIFNVLNTIWQFIKAALTPIFVKLGEVFRNIGQKIRDFLQKPIQLAQDAFKRFLSFLERIPGIGSTIRKLRESFSEGFKQGVRDFRREQERTELGVSTQPGGTPAAPGPGGGTAAPVQREAPGTVRSAAPRQFNINIENLIRQFEVRTTNITEGVDDIKEKVQTALLEAIADVEVAR